VLCKKWARQVIHSCCCCSPNQVALTGHPMDDTAAQIIKGGLFLIALFESIVNGYVLDLWGVVDVKTIFSLTANMLQSEFRWLSLQCLLVWEEIPNFEMSLQLTLMFHVCVLKELRHIVRHSATALLRLCPCGYRRMLLVTWNVLGSRGCLTYKRWSRTSLLLKMCCYFQNFSFNLMNEL